jgi:hypothetical protein
MSSNVAQALPAMRRIELARRTCLIRLDRIDVRPSRSALVPPLVGFVLGGLCFGLLLASILVWNSAFPFPLLAVLLLVSLICLPLSGMGLVYAAFGANVVIDRAKQSATWQQGLLGLGVGTTDLVPFWKIEAILIDEPGVEEGRPTEEFAQWQILLLTQSGRRLEIGRTSALRAFSTEALARATEVATAVARLTGAPLRAPTATEAEPGRSSDAASQHASALHSRQPDPRDTRAGAPVPGEGGTPTLPAGPSPASRRTRAARRSATPKARRRIR